MKAIFSPRCCSALILPSSRRFCWSSPNCAITGPSSWYSDFQIVSHLVCRRTGYVSQGGSAAHTVLQLAPSRMNANASRMLKKSASGVLASLRGSEAQEGIFRSPRSILRANGHTKCGWYLLASSLAAALLDGLFEHPAIIEALVPSVIFQQCLMYKPSFSAASKCGHRASALRMKNSPQHGSR
jgi:hypothetical protein